MEPRDAPTPQRIAGGRESRRSAGTTLLLIAALIAVAFVKPWGDVGTDLDGQSARPSLPRPATRATPRPSATPDAEQLAADRLAEVCLAPSGWRITATERWRDHAIRTWRAIEASTASGPLDPTITFAPVAGEAVPLLGYCAPYSGRDKPPSDARGSVLALDGDVARELRVRRSAPLDDVSGGAAWFGWERGTSGGTFSLTWPVGRYVIRVATADRRYERWIGVEVVRPFLERALPNPSTAIPGD